MKEKKFSSFTPVLLLILVFHHVVSVNGTCSVCSDESFPPRIIIGTDYGSDPKSVDIVMADDTTKEYTNCFQLDQDAKTIFSSSECNQLELSNMDFFCGCPDAIPPEGFGDCSVCPYHDLVVTDEYVGFDLQEACWYGEGQAPYYSNEECWGLIHEYQDVCCRDIQTVPFTVAALQYTGIEEYDPYHAGNCGDQAVDSQFTSDSICNIRDGAECNIGWTEPGEWVEYAFVSNDYDEVTIRVRVASEKSDKKIKLSIVGHPDLSEEFMVPNQGWQVFEDRVWENVPVPRGSLEKLRVTFETGMTNLCSVSIAAAAGPLHYYTIPFTAPALDVTAFNELTPDHIGVCPSHDHLSIDSKSSGDKICYDRGASCTIGWTAPGEWVEYGFVSEFDYVDIIVRVASASPSMTFSIEVGNALGGEYDWAEFQSPGNGWHEFEDIAWRNVALNPHIDDAVRVTFESGFVNMCSISVVPAGVGGGGPEFRVPFHAPALEFAAYLELDNEFHDLYDNDCGGGEIVDAKGTDDAICNSRGSNCFIGWTAPGEFVEYELLAVLDTVDVTVRVASGASAPKQFTLTMYDAIGDTKLAEQTFDAPLLGWTTFQDIVWQGVSVIFVDHCRLRVTFTTGLVNLCSVGVEPS